MIRQPEKVDTAYVLVYTQTYRLDEFQAVPEVPEPLMRWVEQNPTQAETRHSRYPAELAFSVITEELYAAHVNDDNKLGFSSVNNPHLIPFEADWVGDPYQRIGDALGLPVGSFRLWDCTQNKIPERAHVHMMGGKLNEFRAMDSSSIQRQFFLERIQNEAIELPFDAPLLFFIVQFDPLAGTHRYIASTKAFAGGPALELYQKVKALCHTDLDIDLALSSKEDIPIGIRPDGNIAKEARNGSVVLVELITPELERVDWSLEGFNDFVSFPKFAQQPDRFRYSIALHYRMKLSRIALHLCQIGTTVDFKMNLPTNLSPAMFNRVVARAAGEEPAGFTQFFECYRDGFPSSVPISFDRLRSIGEYWPTATRNPVIPTVYFALFKDPLPQHSFTYRLCYSEDALTITKMRQEIVTPETTRRQAAELIVDRDRLQHCRVLLVKDGRISGDYSRDLDRVLLGDNSELRVEVIPPEQKGQALIEVRYGAYKGFTQIQALGMPFYFILFQGEPEEHLRERLRPYLVGLRPGENYQLLVRTRTLEASPLTLSQVYGRGNAVVLCVMIDGVNLNLFTRHRVDRLQIYS
jgi:hypothetical protein